jgi:hypothetical protein
MLAGCRGGLDVVGGGRGRIREPGGGGNRCVPSPSFVSREAGNGASKGLTLPNAGGNFSFLLRGGAAR